MWTIPFLEVYLAARPLMRGRPLGPGALHLRTTPRRRHPLRPAAPTDTGLYVDTLAHSGKINNFVFLGSFEEKTA